jgi:hypothetical protein
MKKFGFVVSTTKKYSTNNQTKYLSDHVMKNLKKNPTLSEVLTTVWEDEKVTSVCPNLVIRLTTLRGEVSKTIWKTLGNNPKDINVLAVGTTAIPHHLTGYQKFLKNFFEETERKNLEFRKGFINF